MPPEPLLGRPKKITNSSQEHLLTKDVVVSLGNITPTFCLYDVGHI